MLVLSMGLSVPYISVCRAATNVVYDFEDDRAITTKKNVTYVQPQQEYLRKKFDKIAARCNKLEKELSSVKNAVNDIKERIHNLEIRLNKYMAPK